MAVPHRVHGLPGGARVVTAPMPERLSASLVFMFGGGSRLEDERQADILTTLGCPLAQGFLFARPMTADHLAAWLKSDGLA